MSKKTKKLLKDIILPVLSALLLAGGLAYAWTEPAVVPPSGNVPAPLNVGSLGQEKSGGLILNTGGALLGLIVDKGDVGIGTQNPQSPAPNSQTGNLDVNDVYLRSISQWASHLKVVQVVSYETGAYATGTGVIPYDDTIPQQTEGTEFMTLTITPKSATNKLMIQVIWNGGRQQSPLSGREYLLALFQDATANALAATAESMEADYPAYLHQIVLNHVMVAGTTNPTTFKVRVGPETSETYYFNGNSSGRKLGGIVASSIIITEYTP